MLVSIEDPGQAVDEQAGLYSYEKSCFCCVFFIYFFVFFLTAALHFSV